ncbi:hypothetical protein M0R19_08730 [Candidatus Pacearchaeota archaeon]|nr:hypothetical protein [Candidatus Pacearchaeota archaeon]
MQIYKPKFWKDHLWILFFVNFILGLAFYLVGVAFLIEAIISFWGGNPALNIASGYVGLAIALLFIPSGQACMWTFWMAYKGTVSFTNREIIYRFPSFSLFFLYKNKIIPYSDIRGVFLGASIMKGVYPDEAKSMPRKSMYMYANNGLIIYFEKNSKNQMLHLPMYHNQEYYAELRKLIVDNNIQQTDSKCLFIKNNSPYVPVAEAVVSEKKEIIQNKHSFMFIKGIIDIFKVLLALAITGALAYLGYYLASIGIF